MNMSYLYLGIAIVVEIAATSALKATNEFTRLIPTLLVITGYIVSFYCLSLALRSFQVGVAYAIWTGIGVAAVTVIAAFLYREVPDPAAIIGIFLIVAGVMVIQLFSGTIRH